MTRKWALKNITINNKTLIYKAYIHYFKYGVVPSRKNLIDGIDKNKAALIALAMWCSGNGIIFEHFVGAFDGYE